MTRACWCGATATTPIATLRRRGMRERFPLVRCNACGTERLDPPPSPEVLARAYGADYYGTGAKKFVGPVGAAFKWIQDSRVRLIRPFVAPDETEPVILDVGCGNGNFLRGAQRAKYVVEGTELSAASAKRAAPRGEFPVHVGELHTLALKAGRYSAVTLWHVLEHLDDPLATMERAHTLLERKGWIFVSLPNAASWQSRASGPGWFHRDPPRHLWHFSPRTLGKLLAKTGFKPMKWWHFALDQNPYGWLQGLLNRSFPQDRFYELLKGKEKLRAGLLPEIACAAMLTPPAFLLAMLEAKAKAGGTITVAARKIDRGARTR